MLTQSTQLPDLSYEEIAEAEEYRRSFKLFAQAAWHVIETGTPFVPGWHIDAICLHLEAVARGDIKRLLVNMPPRHAKSSLISVLWPVWMWLQNPSLRFLCGSYDMALATRDNRKCRLLIRSEWFQQRWGDLFQLRRDQNEKENFENDANGYRIACSVGGGTGRGGDILIIDDLHPIEQKKGMVKRETAIEWFKDTWITRQNDQLTGRMVTVGQRVDAADISAFILEGHAGEQWVHLNLPAEYDPGSACRTYLGTSFPAEQKVTVPSFTDPFKKYEVTFKDGKAIDCTCLDFVHRQRTCKHMLNTPVPVPEQAPFWQDPRTEEGELLWKEKFPQVVIDKEKRIHGILGFACLYQQRPVPAGGNIYEKRNARYFTIDWITETYLLETPRGIKAVPMSDCWKFCTVDPAISEKQSADWFVAAAYAVTPWRDLLLLDILREHFTLPEQGEQIVLYHYKHGFQLWAVESVAFSAGIIQLALTKGVPAQPFKVHTDKVIRSGTASIWDRSGKFYSLKNANWLFDYEKEIYTFPKARHDDMSDTKSMAAIVVCSAIGPGIWDPDDTSFKADTSEPIEQILDAEQIALEQAKQQEAAKAEQPVDPFSWVDSHMKGDW